MRQPPLAVRRPIVAGALAAGLILASCGDDDVAVDDTAATEPSAEASAPEERDGEGSAASSGACALLDETEVASAFGAEPVEVEHEEAAGASLEMCEWRFPAEEEGIGLPPTLQLVLLGPDDYEARMQGGEDLYEQIPGLGDHSAWAYVGSEETGYMVQLLARDGDAAIHLNAAGLDAPDETQIREAFVSLAEDALAGA